MRLKVALALAILVGVCGPAHALEWYMVGAREFGPADSTTEWSTYLDRVYVEPGTSFPSLYAPLRLPDGATLEGLWCHIFDNRSDAKLSIVLERHDHLVTSLHVDIRNILSAESSQPGALGAQKIVDVGPDSRYEVVKDWDGSVATTYYTYYLKLTDFGFCGAGCGIYSCAIGYQP